MRLGAEKVSLSRIGALRIVRRTCLDTSDGRSPAGTAAAAETSDCRAAGEAARGEQGRCETLGEREKLGFSLVLGPGVRFVESVETADLRGRTAPLQSRLGKECGVSQANARSAGGAE